MYELTEFLGPWKGLHIPDTIGHRQPLPFALASMKEFFEACYLLHDVVPTVFGYRDVSREEVTMWVVSCFRVCIQDPVPTIHDEGKFCGMVLDPARPVRVAPKESADVRVRMERCFQEQKLRRVSIFEAGAFARHSNRAGHTLEWGRGLRPEDSHSGGIVIRDKCE